MSTSNQADDLQSFMEEMGDVKPLAKNDTINLHDPKARIADKQKRAKLHLATQKSTFNPLTLENVTPVKPDDFLSFQQAGIQDGVFKNLRLGKYDIEQRISLKGLTLKEASQHLYESLSRCHEKGCRAVLIQHGRGEQSKPFPALKKSYVNHWLTELEEVIAFHSAQPVHGGLGATYALLKKHPEQKLINREKNRRG